MTTTLEGADRAQCEDFHLAQIQDMQRRIVAHLRAGNTTDMAAGPVVVGTGFYTDAAQLAREKATILRDAPLLACLSADMPAPGDVHLFDEAELPIVITRDKAGKVHAFLNLCMHRGARVARTCGRHRKLVCGFHAWSYELDGTLSGVPGKAGFEGLDMAERNLRRVPVVEWGGMIFVRATPGDEPIDIAAWLGDFAPQLAMLRLGDAVPVLKSRLETRANWKLMLDTHGEGYHFAALHPQTIAPNVVSNVSVYDLFGRHYRVAFAQKTHADLAADPANTADAASDITNYSCSMLLFPNTVIFVSTFNLGKEPGTFDVASLDASAFYYGIYRLFPGETPDRTTTLMATYRPAEPAPGIDPGAWEATHRFVEQVLIDEDYAMAAEQHANLAGLAATGQTAVYGRNEIGIQHFHAQVAELSGWEEG